MARGKKKESALTPEEKLAQALVPDWEWPYKVPRNWSWVRLGSFSTNQYGYTAKAIDNNDFPKMLRITDIQDSGVDWDTVPNCEITEKDLEKYILKSNDIVIARIGATTGKSYLLKNPVNAVFASYLIRLRFSENFLPAYVYYFLQSDTYWKQISELSSGIALPGVNSSKLQSMMFPVAPRLEQQRIVDRIEYLFAKLDEAKEKAQSVLDSFETRKAAILHKAFTGELTAKWRELNGVEKNSRITTNVGDIVKLLSGQDFKPEAYNSNGDGIPYITGASNFDNNHVIINRWTSEPTVVAQRADVLLVCKGSGFGKVIIADFETAHIARQIMALRVKDGTDTRFIYYFLQSEYEYLRNNGQGLIPGISRSVVINLPIILPAFSEQLEIVRILDSLFAKEQQAKEAAEAVLEKIDLLKKSILARAFRGELGTNDPKEASAIELIKQLFSDKIEVTASRKSRKSKTPEVNFVAKTIIQALASSGTLTPEKLKAETALQIDDFYDQLKALIDSSQVVETRIDGEVYLEANNENRQPND